MFIAHTDNSCIHMITSLYTALKSIFERRLAFKNNELYIPKNHGKIKCCISKEVDMGTALELIRDHEDGCCDIDLCPVKHQPKNGGNK